MTARIHGVTIVELLVVMAIVGVVLGLLGAFFAQQSRFSAATQARNEVEVNVRTVAEVIAQDLQMTGSRAVYDRDTGRARNLSLTDSCSASGTYGCLTVEETSGELENMTMFYATSLRLTDDEPCRTVEYRATEGVLERSDVACGTDTAFVEISANLTSLRVTFECSHDPAIFSQPCFGVSSHPDDYPVFATVTVEGRSEAARDEWEASATLTTTTPNLRPPVIFVPLP